MEPFSSPSDDSPKLKLALENEHTHFRKFYLWVQNNMPAYFHKEVTDAKMLLIVHGLMSFKVQNYFVQIQLHNAAIVLCIDTPDADLRILKHYEFYGIKDYSTFVSLAPLPASEANGLLRIAIIYFTEADEKSDRILDNERRDELRNFVKNRRYDLSDTDLDQLIDAMNTRFLHGVELENLSHALDMFFRAQTRDDCQYILRYNDDWQQNNQPSLSVILAWRNVPKHNFIYRLARVIFRHGLSMKQVNAAYINPYSDQSILMLALKLHGQNNQAAWEATDITDFIQEIASVKYFGSFDAIDAKFVENRLIRGNLGNFLRCAVNFVHQLLVYVDSNLYSIANIEEGLCHHPEITLKICDAFENKFHPQNHKYEAFENTREEFFDLVNKIDTGNEENDLHRKNILIQAMNFVTFTLKTNFYRNEKTSLGFRLDPEYLNYAPFERTQFFPELPFGIFYIKGMHFIGFHIRFRDLARGGLRTVFPLKTERKLIERNNVFNECYNLAYTQHKKNKDIPEGGAKGVIFLKPYDRLESEMTILVQELQMAGYSDSIIETKAILFRQEQRQEYLYQTQRSFIKTLLSLINCEPDGTLKVKNVIDYWCKPEYIYLGPDENLHNPMIEWIAATAKKYGYRPGGAFISGKPTIGINHKQYGVTSLGVNVCMHEVLLHLGINPAKDSFTVKMTGGPDGDVAGNQILNFHRYYPRTAHLLALTDVSGTIYDPKGLDLAACVELFKMNRTISYYPKERLSEGGFLLDKDTKKDETPYAQLTLCWRNFNGKIVEDWLNGNEMNALYRNNVHQTKADIFIPAGGRPKTLSEGNIQEFLDNKGQATSRAIIEGANLYLSNEARAILEDKGVIIIKDSSANKAGVMCSSFEILCGLALTDQEFMQNKDKLVQEILKIVEKKVRNEVLALLKSKNYNGQHLTILSDEISKKINIFKDELQEHLSKLNLQDPQHAELLQCFINYCPKTLQEQFTARLISEIPDNHQKAIIACTVASGSVYQNGLDWWPSIVDILPILLTQLK